MNVVAASDSGLLYRRVAAVLRAEIGDGSLLPGARLPSIAALAGRCAVAPATIRQALRLLTEEGLVRSRQGSGTFVAEAAATHRRRPQLSLDLGWPALADSIRGNHAEVLEQDDTPPPLAPGDGMPAAAYRRMRRIHRDGDGIAYALVEMHIDRAWFDQAPDRFRHGMALPLLEELGGADLPEMRQTFRLSAADATAARALDLPLGAPLGRVKRSLLDRRGIVAYWSDAVFRGDSVTFEATLRRG